MPIASIAKGNGSFVIVLLQLDN